MNICVAYFTHSNVRYDVVQTISEYFETKLYRVTIEESHPLIDILSEIVLEYKILYENMKPCKGTG